MARHNWQTFIIPRLTYGLEVLTLTPTEINKFDFYREEQKISQFMCPSTTTAAVYLLMGVLPIEAQLDIKTLTFFASMMRLTDSLEREELKQQLAMKSLHSWLVRVCKLLQKYELPTAYDVLNNPQKHCWETLITRAITKYLEKELKEEAATKSSLSYLNLENYILNEIHSTWKIQASVTLTIVKASIHARLLMQQCQFFSNCTASKAYGHPCQLCCPDGAQETMSHFMLRGLAL